MKKEETITIQEPEKLEELNDLCIELNEAAHAYTIRQTTPGLVVTSEVLNTILLQQIKNFDFPIVNNMLLYGMSLIGRFANIAVEEGDLVTLEKEDTDIGQDMIEKNPALISTYLVPLLFYSLEYNKLAHEKITPELTKLSDGTLRSEEEHAALVEMLVAASIQNRFFYLKEWFNLRDLGEKLPENQSKQIIEPGRLIDERE